MHVLYTSHFSGTNAFKQELFSTQHTCVERFFCEKNDVPFPLSRDQFTVVNEFGVFINDINECCESWVIVDVVEIPESTLTGEQCKAQREALFWSREELARRAGLSAMTILRFERIPDHSVRPITVNKIKLALSS